MRLRTAILSFLFVATLPLFGGAIAGKWDVTATDPEGQVHKSQMIVQEEAGALKGVVKAGDREIPMQQVSFAGEELSFKLPWGELNLTIKAKLSGDELKGTFSTDSGDSGTLVAKRVVEAAAATGAAGKWKLTAVRENGNEMKVDLELKAEAGKWSGSIVTPDGMAIPIAEVVVDGPQVSFKIPTDQGSFVLKLVAEGPGMKGTYTTPDGNSGALSASR